MQWALYAFLSAFFAGVVAILAKIGVKDINSNLATAIRVVVIFLFAWGIVFYQGAQKEIFSISKTTLVFLILSGIATGVSWLFYFRALQLGPASKVAPIDRLSLVFTILMAAAILKEHVSIKSLIGVGLMVIGAIFTVL